MALLLFIVALMYIPKIRHSFSAILFALFTLSACRKHTVNITTDDGTGTASAVILPGPVGFDIKDQTVRLGIYNNNLLMNYTENISLLVKPDSLKGAYNIIFDEDFSKSSLKDFTFTTSTSYGTVVTNYLDNNLNNINLTSKSDTTINGELFTKIKFSRFLYYTNPYASYNAAYVEYQYLLGKKDSLSYTSYINFPTRKSSPSTKKVGLTYSN